MDAGQVQVKAPSFLATVYLFPLLPMNSQTLSSFTSTLGSSGFASTQMSSSSMFMGTSIQQGTINFFPPTKIRLKDPAPLAV